MASSDLNLNSVGFQDQLRSKPVRENFTDIENNFNSLRAEVYASIASTASEIVSARDNFGNLTDNIHTRRIYGGYLVTGGVVSEQGTPDMTVAISAGEAIINGVGCDWAAQNSATLTAPGSNTRLDYVVVNSDNSISIVAGTASATPTFPTTSLTQLVVAALVIKSSTTSLNDNQEIFQFDGSKKLRDIYIGSTTTINKGRYDFNNIILDAAITLDPTIESGLSAFQKQGYIFNLKGNFILTANGTIDKALSGTAYFGANSGADATSGGGAGGAIGVSSNVFQSFNTGNGGAGTAFEGAGGGGASFIAAGGAGGAGNGINNTTVTNTASISLFIFCKHFNSYGDITLSATLGATGTNHGNGGGGGGVLGLFCKEDILIGSGVSIDLIGGAGGDGATSDGGGGGGGGGGLFIARSKTYTNNGSIDVSGGSGGVGGGGSGITGTAGGAGLESQFLHTELSSDISSSLEPINFLNLELSI